MLRLTTVLVLWAVVAAAQERQERVDDFYPRPDSPDATILVGDLQLRPDGSVQKMWWHLIPDVPGACVTATQNGVCCNCSAARGFQPECGAIIRHSPEQGLTGTDCTAKWPPGYFGDSALNPLPAELRTMHTVGTVMRHGRRKRHPHHLREAE